jgi:hypothetical protein
VGYVFKSADIRLRFVDGARSGEKTEEEITLAGADLSIMEKANARWHHNRGTLDHRRTAAEDFPMEVFLSWRYCNVDLHLFVRTLQEDGISTHAPGENLCTAPNDYSDPAWTKTSVSVTNNGLNPEGTGTAKRLIPSVTAANISYTASVASVPNEWFYIDFWVKCPTLHQLEASFGITANGGGVPPPAWVMQWTPRAADAWQKRTGGIQNQSAAAATEDVTVMFYPDTTSGSDVMDLWGVYIRKDTPTVLTWDLYIDVYKSGSIDRTIVIPHVSYRDLQFHEAEAATIYGLLLDSKSTYPIELLEGPLS